MAINKSLRVTSFLRRPKTKGRRLANKKKTDTKKKVVSKTKLKKNLKPGQILILLSGCHRGKRVVFLKQLSESGLLLITGPFKLNGTPLRRVNQRYVIVTSSSVEMDSATSKMAASIDDSFFKKEKKIKSSSLKKKGKDESIFMSQDDSKDDKQQLPAEKKKMQDHVDAGLLSFFTKQPLLKQYLQTRFTLRNKQYPHQMVF